MFILYDLNMKQIPFPDGIVPLDIFVSSIAKERQTETIPGRVGVADYGSEYRERSVNLSLMIKSHNAMFYRTQRNRLYELFSEHDVFYIAESHLPSRVLKVAVDDSYIPERISGNAYASTAEITCRTLDSVFWESIYTTKELNDTGYDAAVAKYGLVDGVNHNQVQYVFSPTSETIDLKNKSFEQGLISSSTGEDAPAERYIRSGFISVLPGQTYEFKDNGNNLAIDYWWVYEYDEDNNFIGYVNSQKNNDKKTLPFKSRGYFIRLLANPHELETILSSEVGYSILPQLHGRASKNTFTVYNAGNVTVEPESMLLEISLDYATTSKVMRIKNKTTGEVFEYKNPQENIHVKIHGMAIRRGLYNALRLTNRKFLSLKPGSNEIEITGATFEEFSVNTKFYYK